MKTVAFMTQKGGSGKTTLAVHLAVAAVESGESVALIDTDFQKSAQTWGGNRENEVPVIVSAEAGRVSDVMKAARHDAITFCVIDTAPHAAPEATIIARIVDLVIVPCRPTAFDLAAVSKTVDILRANKVAAVFVLSACPSRSSDTVEARAILESFGFPVAPVEITDRRAFARAVATGRAVTEFETNGKAAEEIRLLWQWIKERVNNDD